MSSANIVGASLGADRLVAGRYAVQGLLGEGAEGRTFSAIDRVTGEPRVLKQFSQRDALTWQRIRRHVVRLADLAHPRIARVRELVADAESWILVQDFVAGSPLRSSPPLRQLRDGKERFARWAWQLAETLAYLHERGLVHGDVSPDNVLLASPGNGQTSDDVLTFIDFAWPQSDGTAHGTLGYASPEALAGRAAPSADLFSLAALLVFAWSGVAPFGEGLAAASSVLRGAAPSLPFVADELGPAWEGLLAGLLAPEETGRVGPARAVLARLRPLLGDQDFRWDLRSPTPDGDPLAGVFVGREAPRAELVRLCEQLALGEAGPAVVCVVGPPGSGRRTLVGKALQDFALAQAKAMNLPTSAGREARRQVTVFSGTHDELERWLALAPADEGPSAVTADGVSEPLLSRHAELADRLERRAADGPILLGLSSDPKADAFARFLSGAARQVPLMVVIAAESAPKSPHVQSLIPGPLTEADVGGLLVSAAPGPTEETGVIARKIWRRTSGHAASAVALVRAFARAHAEGRAREEALEDALGAFEASPTSFVAEGGASVSPALLRRLAVHLMRSSTSAPRAVTGGFEADPDSALARDGQARAHGWLSADDEPRLAPEAVELLFRRAANDPPLATHLRTLATAPTSAPLPSAETLARLGDHEAAGQRLRAALDALSSTATAHGASPGQQMASRLRDGLGRLAPQLLTAEEALEVATSLVGRGDSPTAERLLVEASSRTTEPDLRCALCERLVWALARRGKLAEALSVADGALASRAALSSPQPPGSAPGEAALRARRARVLLSLGRWTEVVASVDARERHPVALEALFLAHAYNGAWAEAHALLPRLSGHGVPLARAHFLEGLLAQLEDEPRRARSAYAAARQEAHAARDVALAASASLNEGLSAGELGDYVAASESLDRAVRDLGRVGAEAELAIAVFNAGVLHTEIGHEVAAARALETLRSHAHRSDSSSLRDLEALLAARIERLREHPRDALVCLARIGRTSGAGEHLVREAARQRMELEALAGTSFEAPDAAALERSTPDDLLTGAFVVLCQEDRSREDLVAWCEKLGAQARADEQKGRWPRTLRAASRAARLAARAGLREEKRALLGLARRARQQIRSPWSDGTPGGLMRDPDVRWLETRGEEEGNGETIARLARAESQLRRLLRINKRLNGETRLPKLLELIIDTVIEMTDAERGLLLLEDDAGVLQVRVARNIDQQTLEGQALSFSRSIAQQVAEAGKPIVTLDAAGDPRFREAVSVSDLHLRSVLAVPLTVKGRVAGTIYVDHRVRRGAFRDEDVALVSDFAEQAALALETTRLVQELRRREQEVDTLNRKLAAELEARKEELRGLQVELRENREALSLRYDYAAIIGRTPPMLDVFRLLDRLTDTQLPVVIQGESGTGKELVARALHFNGPRRAHPFVSENCAALPETLLESTLFGYVRGAFTGADQDRRGLFEVADGGTLFLDEVGEMSPALQGKLLRVLQEGEFRRVGSEKLRKVDVRIVAATNRDLSRMVEEKRFRQDLFYRLSVARIVLPPLRDRREDIPAIVRHLLEKHRPGQMAKAIDTSALVALTAYHWPGNVRELENEILRASAFAADRIGIGDLSPHIAGSLNRRAQADDATEGALALRPRVEALERALIQQALERHGGNQTKAADALGLSRFGLQKKLQRYGMPAREHQN